MYVCVYIYTIWSIIKPRYSPVIWEDLRTAAMVFGRAVFLPRLFLFYTI